MKLQSINNISKETKPLFEIYFAIVLLVIFSSIAFFAVDPNAAKASVGDWHFVSNIIMMITLFLIYLSIAGCFRFKKLESKHFAKFMSFFSVFFLLEDYHWGRDILWVNSPKLFNLNFDCLHDIPNIMLEGLPTIIGPFYTYLILPILISITLLVLVKYSILKKIQLIVDTYLPAKVFLIALTLFGLSTFFDIAMKNLISRQAEDFFEEIIEVIAALTLVFSVLTAEKLDRREQIKI